MVSKVGQLAILQPFVPLGNSGTVPDRFPPHPQEVDWQKSLLYTVFFARYC